MDSLRYRTEQAWSAAWPGLDTTPMTVVGQINRIAAALEVAVEQIYADAGVSATEVQLLVPLRHATDLTAIRLAEQLGMTRAGVSKALNALERRGLLTRTPNPMDRRSSIVELTQSGKDIIDDVFPRELAAHARLLSTLGNRRQRVVDSLLVLADAMDAPDARDGK